MIKKNILGIGLLALGSAQVQAVQNFNLVDHQRTEIQVSNRQLNRIAVKGDRIQQIFGSDEHFHMETDEHGGQIFFKFLSDQMLEPVSITIVTEAGLTQDLTLMPDDRDAQTVLFKPGVGTDGSEQPEAAKSRQDEMVQLIGAMTVGAGLEGFEIKTVVPEESSEELLGFKPCRIYEGVQFKGIVFGLHNNGEVALNLAEQDLVRPGDLAASLSTTTLAPGQSAQLNVIQAVKEMS